MIRQPGFLFVQGASYYGWQTVVTATNGDAVMLPKGTGAVIAAIPDSTVTGGNARGTNAVDWQTSTRAAATQVASGASSVISGGLRATASGVVSVVGGGADNVAGDSSWVPGGRSATTRGNYGRGAWGAGFFATVGDAQAGEFLARALTTNATVTRLGADGSSTPTSTNSLNLPNSSSYAGRLVVNCYQTAGTTIGDGATFECFVRFTRIANAAATTFDGGYYVAPTTFVNTAIVAATGFSPTIAKGGGTAWLLTIAADTTTGGIGLSITGEASKTIRTVARFMTVEVTA